MLCSIAFWESQTFFVLFADLYADYSELLRHLSCLLQNG